jgi:nucleotide-binding universal stress UspA family protein
VRGLAVRTSARGRGTVASRVVVGFDGSEEARRALDWALQEAGIRNAPLRVVAAVQGIPPAELWGVPAPARVSEEELAGARSRTESALTAASQSHPGVSAEVVAVPGHPSAVLIQESQDAALVVVGATGVGGFFRTLLGSVSTAVVERASCPVAIVH